MSGPAAGVLAATELLDRQFRAHRSAEDFGRHGRAVNDGCTDRDVFLIRSHQQDAIERDLVAFGQIAFVIDLEHKTFFDLELASAVFDNCVHCSTRILRVSTVLRPETEFDRICLLSRDLLMPIPTVNCALPPFFRVAFGDLGKQARFEPETAQFILDRVLGDPGTLFPLDILWRR